MSRLESQTTELSAPILGLFGLGQLADRTYADLRCVLRAAVSLGIPTAETGFPELTCNAADACAALQAAIADVSGQISVCLNVSVQHARCIEDFKALLYQKLKLLGMAQAEACTFGPISRNLLARLQESGFEAFLQEELSVGSIKRAGLWVADRFEILNEAIISFPSLSYIRFDYSPLDYLDRPGSYGYTACAGHAIAAVNGDFTMDGRLLRALPPAAEELWRAADIPVSLEQQLLRWTVQTDPSQQIILRPTSAEHLCELFQTLRDTPGGSIPMKEQLLRNNLRDACMLARPVACTACGCCMPCERRGVDIPETVQLYNDSRLFHNEHIPALMYCLLAHEAYDCAYCGQCRKYCPRQHPLTEIMRETERWKHTIP